MSAIRVSGRKNSGINIAGFNSQDGENSYYCKCYNCSRLLESSKDKKILSGITDKLVRSLHIIFNDINTFLFLMYYYKTEAT